MEKIWANRLIAGNSWTWDDVPEIRKEKVELELRARVEAGALTKMRLAEILGEPYQEELPVFEEEDPSEEVIGD